jgi:predicted Rdx family selenoprotein
MWMANEFFRAYGPDVAVTISPRGQGIMEVFLDGEKIFDRKAEGIYPDLARIRKMKEKISAKIASVEGVPTPADN